MLRSSLRSAGARNLNRPRFYSTVKFNENFNNPNPPSKPTLSQFKNAFIHTFLIASSAYMALHTCWYLLEYKDVEKKLKHQAAELEEEMNAALNEAKNELIQQQPKKSWLYFWRRS
ncbi:hypothetical protein CXQ85_000438 [Candidozyma haemuli]|uniref:Inner membrane assembly complex subunit 17 n=1 Tax=Candidozyma haemuli TaxID=45357 RepID=A0A2V1AUE3_9ASCO|nr:hypothetical protein CXQ85_000438 [[Candida] haemuloni]PVH21458.1 hypothetical protein CXQ85_000438 [[Candida] haemuloni]